MYNALAEELRVPGQLVLSGHVRGNRIFVPESFWKHTTALALEGMLPWYDTHKGAPQRKGMVAQHGQAG